MCDDTGLYQHAVHSVPDRDHGYCVDDNARALLLACALNSPGERRLPEALTSRFAAFRPTCLEPRHEAVSATSWASTGAGWRTLARRTATAARCGRSARACAAMPIASRRRWAAGLFAAAFADRGDLPLASRLGPLRCWGSMPIARVAQADAGGERDSDAAGRAAGRALGQGRERELGLVRGKDWPMTMRACRRRSS